jgi:hypothetical protein|tara:strand:- start:218 stop:907 length:690 start_codon:yes stop_codon:yes gene_type:complete
MKQSIKLLFILLGGIATAQTSFTWSPNDTIIQDVNPDLYTEMLIEQINTSGDTLELGIEVVKNTIDESWDGMICLQGLCLGQIRPEGFTSQMVPISGDLNGYTKLTVYPAGGTQSGELRIRVYNLNNPTDGDTCTWIVNSVPGVGLNESSLVDISIYPNPAQHTLNIQSIVSFDKIEIIDLFGKIVLHQSFKSNSNSQCDISSLNGGYYLVRLFNGKTLLKTEKILIHE